MNTLTIILGIIALVAIIKALQNAKRLDDKNKEIYQNKIRSIIRDMNKTE